MPIAAGIIIGAATLIAGAVSAYSNYKANQETNESVEKANEKNLAFAEKQFEEQKYLNRNQYQLTASDMQKAGMNPAMMSGANLTAGSFSSNQQSYTANSIAPDLPSAVSSLASAYINSKTQKSIAESNNETSLAIANKQAESAENVARIQQETQQSIATQRITEEARQFQLKLSQDMSIANIQAELERRGIESREAIAKAERVQQQLKQNDDYQKAMEEIRLEEKRIENARTASERDAAIRSRNGWLNFASSIFHTVVNASVKLIRGS